VVRQDVIVGRPDDIRISFAEAASIYDRIRPSYPVDLFDALFEKLPAEPEIVEVGPGTGQATKDLLARGASVHAIEIGPALAAKMRSNFPSDRLGISVGDFEVMDIAPSAADAVFSATAYHWISREAQSNRPAGVVIEFSSAGLRKPVAATYPSAPLLKALLAAGVASTTASDGHTLEQIGTGFDHLANELDAGGITELATFDHRNRIAYQR